MYFTDFKTKMRSKMKKCMKFVLIGAILSIALFSFSGCGNDGPRIIQEGRADGRIVENGDVVFIDFVGMIDDVPFDGGTAPNFALDIGSGMFIPGFEEQIVGMREGEIRDIDITFPSNYHEPSLAGQATVFRITLNSIPTQQSGSFILELYPHYAPLTVENFVGLVEQGFYNGVVFHRIVDGFMAQGGCPDGTGGGGSGTHIVCETTDNGWTQNTLSHTRGVISMAHAGTNTGSSQFFIIFDEATFLDGRHTGFGRVVEGFETVEQLQGVPRTWGGVGGMELSSPLRPVTIISATTLEDSADGNPRVQMEISWYS